MTKQPGNSALRGGCSPAVRVSLLTALALTGLAGGAPPACAQQDPKPAALPPAPVPTLPRDQAGAIPSAAVSTPSAGVVASPLADVDDQGPKTDIFSKNTVSILLDARLVVSNGPTSWTDGGLGKTRFQGNSSGDYAVRAAPVEADLIWEPRFTGSLSANVSVAWQRDQENPVDLIEAFLNYLPEKTGKLSFSARAGLMWPEISLEHSTGGGLECRQHDYALSHQFLGRRGDQSRRCRGHTARLPWHA